MSVPEIEHLLRLVQGLNSTAAPGDVAARAVAALDLVRRIEDDLCSRRNDAICALHRAGESLQTIHGRTGLSRARLHQIVQAARVSTPVASAIDPD